MSASVVPRFSPPSDDPNLSRTWANHRKHQRGGPSWEERGKVGRDLFEQFKREKPAVRIVTDDAQFDLALLLDEDASHYRIATCTSGRHLSYPVVRVRKNRVKHFSKRS